MPQVQIKTAIHNTIYGDEHVCEIWIGGVRFHTAAKSKEQAMQLAFNAARDLGLPVGTVETP